MAWLRGLAAAVLMFAGLLAPARGDPVLFGGAPNPDRENQPGGPYYVILQTAVADAIAWSKGFPSPAQIIQNCMNAELTNAGQDPTWPLPVQKDAITNLTFTVNTPDNPQNYTPLAVSTICGAKFIMTAQNMPAGDHWLQLVHLNYLPDNIKDQPGSTWPDPGGNGFWIVDNANTLNQPFYDLVPPQMSEYNPRIFKI